MKKLFLLSLVFIVSLSANAQSGAPVKVATITAESARVPNTGVAAMKPTLKKLSVKQKIQKFWNKISKFDFESLNIVGKTEKFVAGKKKQNLEAVEGAETGIWKHTTRMPASGQAKQIADRLDKTTQEKLKKYNSIDSY